MIAVLSLVSDPDLPPLSAWLFETVVVAAAWCAARPWLAALAAGVGAAGAAAVLLVGARRRRLLSRNAKLVMISPPPQVDPDGAAMLWAAFAPLLHTGWRQRLRHPRPHLALEYRWSGLQLRIAVWVPAGVPAGAVQAAIRGAWPGATCTVGDADAPLPDGVPATGAVLVPGLPAWYLLRTDHPADPLRTLIAAAADLREGESCCLQILARPAGPRQTARLRRGAQALRTGRPPAGLLDPATWLRLILDVLTGVGGQRRPASANRPAAGGDPRDARAAADKLAGPCWETAVRYGITIENTRGGAVTTRLSALSRGITAGFGAWTGRNRLRHRHLARPAAVLAGRSLRSGFLLAAAELATLAALPRDVAVPGLDRARARIVPAPVAVPRGGRAAKVLGNAAAGGRSVALPVPDARQHVHVLGSTGSGKSTLLLNMILDDIHARRGTIVIDPKGDLVLDLLDRIPAGHARRLVLIDPDQPAATTLNPLAGDDHDLVVDNIVSIFGRIFAKHWGPRIDDTLRVACLTLLRKANATLTLIPPLLNDRRFRASFTADLDDPEGLRGYWEWFESTPPPLRAQVIGPVLARLRAFLLRDFVRRTLGAPQSSFDMRRVLDGGILLARLPKGQIGEETTRLMGSFIVASAWQAATGRARQSESERRDACVYMDEAVRQEAL